ncbi:ubiquilin-1-like [Melanotaenia boesemani]|uniref:ubiquilin-1-like n=1 Tax=Melanotaenia boesemani TaxID=1250792 RepID=UPI001C05DA1A|nr:ubiquilin-1-like [Melanotaenia boesemani]
MSDSVKEEPKTADNRHRSKTIHVAVRSSAESRDFTVRGDCTVRQLKWALSERLRAPAEQLVLIHFGRVLREAELLSHLKEQNGSVSLCVIRRPQPLCSQASNNSSSETFKSEHTAVPDPDPTLTPTPTSPRCLVEGVESIDLENNGPGFFSAVQLQMEMRHVLGSPFVQSNLSNSGPELTRQLILSNPQIQQPLQTNPEVLELFRNPDMIEELMQNEDRALDNLPSEQGNPKITSASSGILQEKQAKTQQRSLKQEQNKTPVVSTSSGNPLTLEAQSNLMPSLSSDSADPLRELTATPRADLGSQSTITAGMQSLLEEITASPGLMESLLSGPYVSSLLNCLSRNPDLAEQMLLSHPLFSGNPQLQQQMRQQIPLFLQQMQSPELLSAMLNPRAMKALLQIQQGLQTLAAETVSLTPATGLGTSGSSEASDLHCESTPNNQPGTRLQAATVTEQQQQFVHQMLQALANTNSEVRHEEDEFKEELEQLNSMGFSDRRANLEALISTGGDLSTAIQHLLSL